jgi:hypothetical protein
MLSTFSHPYYEHILYYDVERIYNVMFPFLFDYESLLLLDQYYDCAEVTLKELVQHVHVRCMWYSVYGFTWRSFKSLNFSGTSHSSLSSLKTQSVQNLTTSSGEKSKLQTRNKKKRSDKITTTGLVQSAEHHTVIRETDSLLTCLRIRRSFQWQCSDPHNTVQDPSWQEFDPWLFASCSVFHRHHLG